jgi:hypothetical protein
MDSSHAAIAADAPLTGIARFSDMPVPYTIIVNTSDGYRDCWEPFFVLFARYWPDCEARILLNTEQARFEFPNLDIESTQVQRGCDRRLTWGQCMINCLAMVDTPLVLYLQEDYFLDAPVNVPRLNGLARRMLDNARIGQIGLTTFGAFGPFSATPTPELWTVAPRSRYRTSLQAAFWRVDTLRSYLRPEENGWMFEIYGTRRSWRRDDLFLTVNRDRERTDRTFPYEFAGIIKGQWASTVPAFFAREGITVDFSKRGFFKPRPRAFEKLRTARKLLEHPSQLARGLLGR